MKKHLNFISICWPVLVVLTLGYFASAIKTENIDIWIHNGRLIYEQGSLSVVDNFLITPKTTFFPTVLSSLLYFCLFKTIGYTGIGLFQFIIVYLIAFQLLKHLKELTHFQFIICTISFLAIFPFILPGPESLAFVLFLYCFECIKRPSIKRLLIFSVCFFLWTITHPSFLIFSLFALYQLVKEFQKNKKEMMVLLGYVLSFLLLSISSILYFDLIHYAHLTREFSIARGISQWMPLNPWANLEGFFYLLLLAGVFIKATYKKLKLSDYGLLSVLILASCLSWRLFPWFIFAALPLFLSSAQSDFLKTTFPKAAPMAIKFLSVCFIIIVSLRLFSWETDHSISKEHLERIRGENYFIFNEWRFGGELLSQNIKKITIDNRNTIYSNKEFEHYKSVLNAKSSDLLKYNVFVLGKEKSPLLHKLRGEKIFVINGPDYYIFIR